MPAVVLFLCVSFICSYHTTFFEKVTGGRGISGFWGVYQYLKEYISISSYISVFERIYQDIQRYISLLYKK
ncbi:hypothetical protein HFA01_08350 [Halobacillus faecis]|uniref:Uncharacterized protein n=1 Tax=Halobacillus faecis TaxID=360184 RepID=A0A511WQM6_9BACI|nr:hypothetical protein HFA01_08350 [Halobacillus faecis]